MTTTTRLHVFIKSSSSGDGGYCDDKEQGSYDWRNPSFKEIEIKSYCCLSEDNAKKEDLWAEAVEVEFEPKVGSQVFMVVPRYSTGNTFGTSYGEYTIHGIYSTLDKAQSVVKFLETEYDCYREAKINLSYRVWMGFFERLEEIQIEVLEVYE